MSTSDSICAEAHEELMNAEADVYPVEGGIDNGFYVISRGFVNCNYCSDCCRGIQRGFCGCRRNRRNRRMMNFLSSDIFYSPFGIVQL